MQGETPRQLLRQATQEAGSPRTLRGAYVPTPNEGGGSNCNDCCSQVKKDAEWQYVGQGRGPYTRGTAYNFVGESGGSYVQEDVVEHAGWKVRPCCYCFLAAVVLSGLLLAMIGFQFFDSAPSPQFNGGVFDFLPKEQTSSTSSSAEKLRSTPSPVVQSVMPGSEKQGPPPVGSAVALPSTSGLSYPTALPPTALPPTSYPTALPPTSYPTALPPPPPWTPSVAPPPQVDRAGDRAAAASALQGVPPPPPPLVGAAQGVPPPPPPLVGAAQARAGPVKSDEVSYDCEEGYQTWMKTWKKDKITWCCRFKRKACTGADVPAAVPKTSAILLLFNCTQGLSNWQRGWSDTKKEWCCKKVDCYGSAAAAKALAARSKSASSEEDDCDPSKDGENCTKTE